LSTKENQTRSMATNFSTREETTGEKIIEGYFAVFNQETELWSGAFEEISPEAFDGSLSNDIRALTNHETTLVLGRNKSGTLKLSVDSRGLYERVKRGDVDQCSFGFNILNEETDWREDGTVKWLLKEIDLHEVSVVTFPAYEDTGVQARHNQLEQYREKQTQQWRKNLLDQLKNRGK